MPRAHLAELGAHFLPCSTAVPSTTPVTTTQETSSTTTTVRLLERRRKQFQRLTSALDLQTTTPVTTSPVTTTPVTTTPVTTSPVTVRCPRPLQKRAPSPISFANSLAAADYARHDVARYDIPCHDISSYNVPCDYLARDCALPVKPPRARAELESPLLTRSPLQTSPVTTSPVTTSPVTTSPVTVR